MKALAPLALKASIGLSSAAHAGPARMLVLVRYDSNPIAVLDFDSLEDCDATADHVAQIKARRVSSIGLPGAWKDNFKPVVKSGSEPRISMLCLPSVDEIPAVAEGLKANDFYRNLYE